MVLSSGDSTNSVATSLTSTVMRPQLVIECDGVIHEDNESWQHDHARDAYMVGYGLHVMRFTNEEVLNNTENVLRKVAEFLLSANVDASFKKQQLKPRRPSPNPSQRRGIINARR